VHSYRVHMVPQGRTERLTGGDRAVSGRVELDHAATLGLVAFVPLDDAVRDT
jgi:hypothetical protein